MHVCANDVELLLYEHTTSLSLIDVAFPDTVCFLKLLFPPLCAISDIHGHHLCKILTSLSLCVCSNEATLQIVADIRFLKLAVTNIRVRSNLYKRRRIVPCLVKDVSELMVDCLNVVVVQTTSNIVVLIVCAVKYLVQKVNTSKKNLLSPLGCTKDI